VPVFEFESRTYFYQVYGQGSPLLLLNGIMMSTKSWQPFVKTLSQHHQLILCDMLDQGQSARADFSYSQAYQVAIIRALLTHLNLEKVILLGISYGGEVALQFAVKYPQQVSRLLLFHTVAQTDSRLLSLGKTWNDAALKGDGLQYYELTIPIIYSTTFQQKQAAWLHDRKQLLLPIFHQPAFLQAMIRLTLSAESHNVIEQLSTLTMPTLIVGASEDTLTPLAYQEYLATHIPNARLIVLPHTGHASMYEQPDIFTRLTLGFSLDVSDDYKL
jgi:3-oxoadipate enol-lactonase